MIPFGHPMKPSLSQDGFLSTPETFFSNLVQNSSGLPRMVSNLGIFFPNVLQSQLGLYHFTWGPLGDQKKKIRPSCNFLKVLTPASSKANRTPIRSSWDSIQPWQFFSKFHSKLIGTIKLWHEFFWASHPTPFGFLGFYQTLDKIFQNFFQSLLGASDFFIKPFGHPMEALHGQDGFLSTLWGFLSNPIQNLSKPSRILSNPEHLFFQSSCKAHWACMAFTGFFFGGQKKSKAPLQFFGASDPKLIQVNPEACGFPLCARWIKWMCPLGSFDAFDHVYDFTPNLWGIPSNLLWTQWHSMDTPSTAGRRGLYFQLPYIHENFFDFFFQNFFFFRFRSTKVFHWICLASCPCNLSGGLWVSWTPLFPLTCWLFHLLPNNHIWLID